MSLVWRITSVVGVLAPAVDWPQVEDHEEKDGSPRHNPGVYLREHRRVLRGYHQTEEPGKHKMC